MLTITFRNDCTGPKTAANYNVEVAINDKVIEIARIEGHNRDDGWRALVRRLVYSRGSVE